MKPFLILEDAALEQFEDIDTSEPHDAVVIGLAPSKLDYKNLNKAFSLVQAGKPLIGIHKARYFASKENELSLGPGGFIEALEYASGVKSELPKRAFYELALKEMNLMDRPDTVAMIGDDVKTDLGDGVLELGLKRILVKTGKYLDGDEEKAGIPLDGVFASFSEAVDAIVADHHFGMEQENSEDIDKTTDIEFLRGLLKETTTKLHQAAEVGLNIAIQNQDLQERLRVYEQEYQGIKDKLALFEHEQRRWQQESFRIDEMSANIADLRATTAQLQDSRSLVEEKLDKMSLSIHTIQTEQTHINQAVEEATLSRDRERERNASIQKTIAKLSREVGENMEEQSEIQAGLNLLKRDTTAKHVDVIKQIKALSAKTQRLDEGQGSIRDDIRQVYNSHQFMKMTMSSVLGDFRSLMEASHPGTTSTIDMDRYAQHEFGNPHEVAGYDYPKSQHFQYPSMNYEPHSTPISPNGRYETISDIMSQTNTPQHTPLRTIRHRRSFSEAIDNLNNISLPSQRSGEHISSAITQPITPSDKRVGSRSLTNSATKTKRSLKGANIPKAQPERSQSPSFDHFVPPPGNIGLNWTNYQAFRQSKSALRIYQTLSLSRRRISDGMKADNNSVTNSSHDSGSEVDSAD
ncbi:hypothetical protein H4219_001082 [Mycoemilia scoparia]|uniref:Uncharacterized protein n=1 Tax=Mycoemilia scoparia TaxID=417184 RepID=A0A9W8A987_9FUNG|nr:hypothetical protein H4219_001082 [Mycoemilia scoparia]